MADQDYATVSGVKVRREDFAYAPEGSGPSEWKLPLHDAGHVRNALARYNQTDLPAGAKAGVYAKIVAAAKRFGVEVNAGNSELRNSKIEDRKSADFPVSLFDFPTSSFGLSEVANGLVRVAVAYTGKFSRDGKEFEITPKDLEEMRDNLAKREVPIDYEHLSAAPAPPGWARAAGWIRRPAGIEEVGSRKSEIGNRAARGEAPPRPYSLLPTPDSHKILWSWAEFTPACLAMIKQKEYRYFSPEIRWKDANEAGAAIGTRLAAGAMTNRPFLKDLPPIEISDADYQSLFGLAARQDGKLAAVTLSEAGPDCRLMNADCRLVAKPGPCNRQSSIENRQSLVSLEQIHVPGALENISIAYPQGGDSESGKSKIENGKSEIGRVSNFDFRISNFDKEKRMKKFTLKKFSDGEHAGKHMVMDGEEPVGEIAAAEIKSHFKQHFAEQEPDADDQPAQAGKKVGEITNPQSPITNSGLSESALLVEAFPDGKIDRKRAAALCDEGKLKPGTVFRAQEAEDLVDKQVQAGKILPKNRAAAFRVALEEPEAFQALFSDVKPAVDTRSLGVSGPPPTGSMELTERVRQYAQEKKCSISQALTEFTQTPEGKKLWEEHTREVVKAAEGAEEEE